MSVKIHGKEYITVNERVLLAKEDLEGVETEVLAYEPVVIKATVKLKGGQVFTGISAANPSKSIEKESPYEVAETSAVGRALGFAGYGITNGIASADEIKKASASTEQRVKQSIEPKITASQLNYLSQLMATHRLTNEEMCEKYGVSELTELTKTQASAAIEALI